MITFLKSLLEQLSQGKNKIKLQLVNVRHSHFPKQFPCKKKKNTLLILKVN